MCLFLSPWSDLHLVHDDEYDGEVEDLQRRVGQLEGAQVVVQTAQLILPTASAQLSSFSQRKIQGPIPPRLSPLIYEFWRMFLQICTYIARTTGESYMYVHYTLYNEGESLQTIDYSSTQADLEM